MKQQDLTMEITYRATGKQVWEAITSKDQMRNWYFEVDDFKAEPCFEFQFYGTKEGRDFLHRCKVVAVKSPQLVSYTWRYDGYPGTSLVTMECSPAGEGHTKLKLTHSGLSSFPQNNDFALENFEKGWHFLLNTSLANFLATLS